MLFAHLDENKERFKDDIQRDEHAPECLSFDRPLLLLSELHVAGAMAFATSCGVAGMSLVQWALRQTIDSVEERQALHTILKEGSAEAEPKS